MLKKVTTYVIAFHLLALCYFAFFAKAPPSVFTPKNLKVETVKLRPQPQVTSKPVAAQPKKTTEKKKSSPPPPPKKKKVVEKKKSSLSVSKEIDAAIAKIEASTSKAQPSTKMIDAPKKIALDIDRGNDTTGMLYRNELSTFLQSSLRLPEYGEVTIEIEITSDGKILNFKVLSSQSATNRLYIEKELPKLKFPSPSAVQRNKKLSFVLTFCNEID